MDPREFGHDGARRLSWSVEERSGGLGASFAPPTSSGDLVAREDDKVVDDVDDKLSRKPYANQWLRDVLGDRVNSEEARTRAFFSRRRGRPRDREVLQW
jgi:hypothetical protein